MRTLILILLSTCCFQLSAPAQLLPLPISTFSRQAVTNTTAADWRTKLGVSASSTNAMQYMGNLSLSGDPNYPAGTIGDTYRISANGYVGGGIGVGTRGVLGDILLCLASNAGGTQAAVGSSWMMMPGIPGSLLAEGNLATLTSPSTARGNLGLIIGTHVQAYDADLTTWAGISPSANVQTLLGAADYAAFRSSLGLGTMALEAASSYIPTTTLTNLALLNGTNAFAGTNTFNGPVLLSSAVTASGLTASRLVATDANKALASTLTSANLAASVSDETGSGLLVMSESPTIAGTLFDQGDGPRAFGIQTLQNNSADIHIRSGGNDGLKVKVGGGVSIDNSASPDSVPTLLLNPRGTQLAALLSAGGFTVGGTGQVTAPFWVEFTQTSDGGTPSANSARIYAKDSAGTAEVFVKDEAGNETQISPHARNSPGKAVDAGLALPIVVHHRNDYLGTEEWIHLSALARKLEQITGEKFVFSQAVPKRDWAADQQAKQAAYDALRFRERQALLAWQQNMNANKGTNAPAVRPAADIRKPKPEWLK
ncbi:MAG: hypothetical protein FD161_886 [Limisphaerales bacterium]|nr:MAG: hypothetical protein FD161_886 [Limisphaerales bacterium]KAG0510045.1 MAG: hypothetical protein E1N63_886 [Limisphaerales bacterium]TXT53065.1 MAG: hypothetical protein FD140_173 [Limisphaerales bacterium]